MGRDLTVRLAEDRPGELARVVQTLSRSGVNIEGFAEVDGAVHVLARDPNAARAALRAGGYRIEGEVEVLVLPMPDSPGELPIIMQGLAVGWSWPARPGGPALAKPEPRPRP